MAHKYTLDVIGHNDHPSWVMDFVRPCVLMVNEDDTFQRTVIQVLIPRPLPFFHQLQLNNLICCCVIPHP